MSVTKIYNQINGGEKFDAGIQVLRYLFSNIPIL